jgi:hypothetical protein
LVSLICKCWCCCESDIVLESCSYMVMVMDGGSTPHDIVHDGN